MLIAYYLDTVIIFGLSYSKSMCFCRFYDFCLYFYLSLIFVSLSLIFTFHFSCIIFFVYIKITVPRAGWVQVDCCLQWLTWRHLVVTLCNWSVFVHVLCVDHPTLEPRHFVEEKIVNEYHQDYMFLECIKFINEVCVISWRLLVERPFFLSFCWEDEI